MKIIDISQRNVYRYVGAQTSDLIKDYVWGCEDGMVIHCNNCSKCYSCPYTPLYDSTREEWGCFCFKPYVIDRVKVMVVKNPVCNGQSSSYRHLTYSRPIDKLIELFGE